MNTLRFQGNALSLHDSAVLFSSSVASVIGLNEAIILQEIHMHCSAISRQENQEQFFKDGRFWAVKSLKQWSSLFGWWSDRTIRRSLKNLEDMGIVKVNIFNENPLDQRLWRAIDYDKLEEILRGGQS